MTVAVTISEASFVYTGAQTSFPLGFGARSTAHIYGELKNSAGVVVPLTNGVNFSVSIDPVTGLATATRLSFPSAGSLRFWRRSDFLQSAAFQTGEAVPAETHEELHDAHVLRLQEVRRDLDRSIRSLSLPTDDPVSVSGIIPPAAARAGKALGFDANGSAIALTITDSTVFKLDGPINAKWFGVKGDGVTDDTAAINNALLYAASFSAAASVYLPNGIYRIAGTIIYPKSGVGLEGDSLIGTTLYFDNGAADCIVLNGTIMQPIDCVRMERLFLDHAAKTGGRTIYAPYCRTSVFRDLFLNNPYNGIDWFATNNLDVDNIWIQDVQGSYGYYWRAPGDGSTYPAGSAQTGVIESQFLKIGTIGCNANTSGADCFIIDGFCQSLAARHLELAGGRYNLWIRNTSNSATWHPGYFGVGHLWATIAKLNSVRIDGGRWMDFGNPRILNNTGYAGQGNADGAALVVSADASGSLTRGITFGPGMIGMSKGSALEIGAVDIVFNGTKFPASSNTPNNAVDAVNILSTAANIYFNGTHTGFEADGVAPNNWRYGLAIAAGATNIDFIRGDWTTGCQTGGVNADAYLKIFTASQSKAAQLHINRGGGADTFVGITSASWFDFFPTAGESINGYQFWLNSTTLGFRVNSDRSFEITGSLRRNAPATKTGNFAVAANENWLVCNGAGTITVTLPAASLWAGREIMLKTIAAQAVVSASSNVAPINSSTAGTAILAATAGKWATLVSDGANWVVMSAN